MGIYEGKLTQAEIKRAAENGPFLEEKGRRRGGVHFLSKKWVIFDSDKVDMDSIMRAAEPIIEKEGPQAGKKVPGELEVRHKSGEKWKPVEVIKTVPGTVGERISPEEQARAREEELERRKNPGKKKPGRPPKAKVE